MVHGYRIAQTICNINYYIQSLNSNFFLNLNFEFFENLQTNNTRPFNPDSAVKLDSQTYLRFSRGFVCKTCAVKAPKNRRCCIWQREYIIVYFFLAQSCPTGFRRYTGER